MISIYALTTMEMVFFSFYGKTLHVMSIIVASLDENLLVVNLSNI